MATSNEKARNAASAERRADIVAAAREIRVLLVNAF